MVTEHDRRKNLVLAEQVSLDRIGGDHGYVCTMDDSQQFRKYLCLKYSDDLSVDLGLMFRGAFI